MSGTLTYIGEESLTVCLPGAVAALAADLGALQAQLAALVNVKIDVQISFAAQITLCEQIIASLKAAIAAGLSPPTVAAQAQIQLNIIAALRASIKILVDFLGLLATGGVFAYAWDGPIPDMGAAITAALHAGFPDGSGITHANALILGTSLTATWTAMGGIFKLTP